jgi:hypothetical protein
VRKTHLRRISTAWLFFRRLRPLREFLSRLLRLPRVSFLYEEHSTPRVSFLYEEYSSPRVSFLYEEHSTPRPFF